MLGVWDVSAETLVLSRIKLERSSSVRPIYDCESPVWEVNKTSVLLYDGADENTVKIENIFLIHTLQPELHSSLNASMEKHAAKI